MQVTLERPLVKQLLTMSGTLSLFLVPEGYAFFGLSLAFPFCLLCDGSNYQSFIGF